MRGRFPGRRAVTISVSVRMDGWSEEATELSPREGRGKTKGSGCAWTSCYFTNRAAPEENRYRISESSDKTRLHLAPWLRGKQNGHARRLPRLVSFSKEGKLLHTCLIVPARCASTPRPTGVQTPEPKKLLSLVLKTSEAIRPINQLRDSGLETSFHDSFSKGKWKQLLLLKLTKSPGRNHIHSHLADVCDNSPRCEAMISSKIVSSPRVIFQFGYWLWNFPTFDM